MLIERFKWLLLIAVATVLSGAIILVNNNTRKTESKLKQQILEVETNTRKENQNQLQQLKNKVQELDTKLQSKAAEKARLATEASKQTLASAPAPVQAVKVSGTCADWMAAAGVSDMANAAELIRRESGCNPNAVNKSSGACGIPQALPCSKLGTSNPIEQIRWMERYVKARYGSWANAIHWHNVHNWY